MRYPVGKTTEDFNKNWYNAQGYGSKTSYGYHEGDDFNLKTGGNTDLGQPLYAIADGEISGVDTTSTTGFGKQIFIKFIDPLDKTKFYWCMYAHCNSVMVKQGDKVKEGQQVGTLGKSGTTFAHLHFSIKNTPNGMDNVANNLVELKQWENPSEFIKARLDSDNNMDCKNQVIDYDDGEGNRHEFGWYVSEWWVEKQANKEYLSELEKIRKESEGLRLRNAELAGVVSERDKQVTTLTNLNNSLHNEISDVELANSNLEAIKVTLEGQITNLEDTNKSLMTQIKELKEQQQLEISLLNLLKKWLNK